MPTNTYTPLATLTLTGSDSSITFANIPQTYRDLVLISVPYGNQTNDAYVSFNGISSDFSGVRMYGNSGGAVSNTYSDNSGMFLVSQYIELVHIWHLMDYSATNKHKTLLIRSNRPQDSFVSASAHRWANTAAVTSITITAQSPFSFSSGATFNLFGIAA